MIDDAPAPAPGRGHHRSGSGRGPSWSLVSCSPHLLCHSLSSGQAVEPAAVYVKGRTDAVAGVRGTQKHEELGQFFRTGEAPDRGVLLGDVVQVRLPAVARQLARGLLPVG